MHAAVTKIKTLPINRLLDVIILGYLLLYPVFHSTYWVYIMSGIMAYMIFALSLDLLWGYTGLMSMGHSVLFGAGGYMIGISCSYLRQAEWIEYDRLPWFLSLLGNEWGALAMALLLPALIALILGIFMFSGKIQGIFFSLITLALSGIAQLFVINSSRYTHGDSGITITSRTVISNDSSKAASDLTYYFIVLAFLIGIYLLCLALSHSRVGKVLQAIRENEARITFFGYNPSRFKLFILVLSGMIAGMAGVLYVRVQGSINYTSVGISLSTLVLVWIAVGGRGNLTGAMLGTLILQIAETKLNSLFSGVSSDFAQYWKLVLGIIILVIVFLIPKGIVGTVMELQQKYRDHKRKEQILAKEGGSSHE
jgi:urea transport system permease protein